MIKNKGHLKKSPPLVSNPERHQESWHPYWVWQLLRRNDQYKIAIDELQMRLDKAKGNLIEVIQNENRTKEEMEQAMKSHSMLRELFYELQNEKLSLDMSIVKDIDNSSIPLSNIVPYQYRSNSKMIHFLNEDNFTESDRILLAKFRSDWGGVISWPLHYSVESPVPDLLCALITFQPVRFHDHEIDLTVGSLNQLAREKLNKTEKIFIVNTSFSDDAIRDALSEMLSQMRGKKKLPQIKWTDFNRKIRVYDLFKIGEKRSKIIECIWGKSDDVNINNTNGTKCDNWRNSIQKYIDSFSPEVPCVKISNDDNIIK